MYEEIINTWKAIPIVGSLGMTVDSVSEGQAVVTVPRREEFDGVFQCYHGGMLMTVADTMACLAIMTKTGPDQKMTTTDMNIRFLSACHSAVTAKAKVIKAGRTLCPVHVDLFNSDGKQVCVAQVNYMLL